MDALIPMAKEIQSFSVTGILALIVLVEGWVIRVQFKLREDCIHKLLRAAEGKDITE